MYTFATHASELSENPRSCRIDGSATPTIVTSRTIIRYPRQTMISASQRFVLGIRSDMSLDSSVVVSTEESEHAPGSRHAGAGRLSGRLTDVPPMTSARPGAAGACLDGDRPG